MISPELEAEEREVAERIIRLCRLAFDERAEGLIAAANTDPARAQAAKGLELRYAILAMVESAIADGFHPAQAFLLTRDTAIWLWGLKLYAQHAGQPCIGCVRADAEEMTALLRPGAGVEATVSSSLSVSPASSAPTTRH